MPLADLLSSLRARGARERNRLLEEAAREAERIRSEAVGVARRTRREALARAEAEERVAARREVAQARRAASVSVLEARDGLLERVRSSVRTGIPGVVGDPRYLDPLPGRLAESLGRLPPGPVMLRAGESTVSALRAALAGQERVEVVPTPGHAVGYTLCSADGAVEVDERVETRLDVCWPAIAARVAAEVDE